MTRLTRIFTLAAALTLFVAAAPVAAQQTTPAIPDSMQARTLPRQHLSGPRFGFTAFTGDVAPLVLAVGKSPSLTQLGWQFQTQIVSTPS
mgnify:CR=1 FL=1